MKKPRTTSVFPRIAAFWIPLFTAILLAAQPYPPAADTYSWGAKFVSVDASAPTVTVSARVTGFQPMIELPKFKSGDRILLTWAVQAALNGPSRYADAISDAVLYDGRQKLEPFTFVAEFVSFDAADPSVTFRTAVAADIADQTRSLKLGESLIATSPVVQPAASPRMVSIQQLVSLSSSY